MLMCQWCRSGNFNIGINLVRCLTRLSSEGPVSKLHNQSPSTTAQLYRIVRIAIFQNRKTNKKTEKSKYTVYEKITNNNHKNKTRKRSYSRIGVLDPQTRVY